ncbi:PRC-barrel domain-containing protein [Streptomyces sp. NPDC048232]|uniref:PRC-barrel domain-containing protein n=1 Tax=unclassified Streptomyces TaxID=2593676 RepID=UPI000F027AE1|nr:PRC-barrel domain-containing protein [Streptomyces sp. Tu 4128]
MFEAENIRDWRGQDVVDQDGRKIGTLESIYFDTLTDRPAFATITVGLPTRRRLVFVPVDKAVVGPGYVKVTYDKSLVKDAPGIDPDGELAAEEEGAVFEHYKLPYEQGSRGERRLGRR